MKAASIFILLFFLGSSGSLILKPEDLLNRALKRQKDLLDLESSALKRSSRGHSSITNPTKEASIRYGDSVLLEFATLEGGKRFPRRTSPIPCDTPKCSSLSRYRTFDGACNNLIENPRWGARLRPLRRILPSAYQDGVSAPRLKGIKGNFLPNARAVSNRMHQGSRNQTFQKRSLMLMQWGQFLDHDVSFSPSVRALRTGEVFDCGACDSAITVHPSCFPILIPKNDPYFSKRISKGKRGCMAFTRSMPGQTTLGSRQQLNQNTGLLDCSHIYGSSSCANKDLRTSLDGRLKVLAHPRNSFLKPLMPMKKNVLDCQSHFGMCFQAGDDRSNEQPGLTALHTLFLREHNSISERLRAFNPGWNDETLFQESRRVLMAINQLITYKEFLPRILGPVFMEKYGLTLMEDDRYYDGYDPTCSSDIFNEFSTAAFRFGHTIISPMVKMVRNLKSPPKALKIRKHFNNPDVVRNANFIDLLMAGLTSQEIEPYDSTIDFDLRNRLFEESRPKNGGRGKNKSVLIPFSGLDLAAINIQRGRDHGLPGYVEYRNWCVPSAKVNNFDDLLRVMGNEVVQKLKKAYNYVEDIDLFTGGLAEPSMKGSLVGETFGCIIGQQFKDLRRCDRFWFENPFPESRFTLTQLKEIKKVTLASVICRNCEKPQPIQRMSMDLPDSNLNPKEECSSLPKINFEHWTDKRKTRLGQHKYCEVQGRLLKSGSEPVRIGACTECTCPKESIEGICRTLVVKSCDSLTREFGYDVAVMDDACVSQCPDNFSP